MSRPAGAIEVDLADDHPAVRETISGQIQPSTTAPLPWAEGMRRGLIG